MKMNLFFICILFGLHVLVKDVELLLTLTPTKNPEVATLGTNQFAVSCSYSTDSSDSLIVLELYRKRAAESAESKIMIFPATGSNKNVSYLDATLKTRTSSDWPNAGNQANLVFSSIACDDKASYMWKATYFTTQAEIAVTNTSINVLVKSITIFNNTAGQITYSPSINLAEGDEVAFTCSGDVGNEPVGYLGWYYYLKSDPTKPVNASSWAEEAPTPEYQSSTCSFTRSSALKLTLTKEFNQLLVRCTVQQSKYDQFGDGHRQTSAINVFYSPRIDKLKVKTVGDSVTLNCNADSNPPPTYYWLLPKSETWPGSQLQLANLTENNTGVYTCVAYNTYKNENHTTNTSTIIDAPKFRSKIEERIASTSISLKAAERSVLTICLKPAERNILTIRLKVAERRVITICLKPAKRNILTIRLKVAERRVITICLKAAERNILTIHSKKTQRTISTILWKKKKRNILTVDLIFNVLEIRTTGRTYKMIKKQRN